MATSVLSATPASAQPSRPLQRHLAAVRRKRVVVSVTTGLALAVVVLVSVFAAEATLDWLAELPWAMRALVLAGALSGAGFFLWREVVRPLRVPLPDDAVALLIERALPGFDSRFISSVQLARAERQPSAFIRTLLAQTEALAGTLDFRKVVRTVRLRWLLLAVLGLLALAAGLVKAAGPAAPLLLRRALLLNAPLPRKTQITNLTGDRRIGVGEDLKIEALAGGIIPPRGTVLATNAQGQKREYPLEAEADRRGHFSSVVRSPQEGFSYVIRLNDAVSPAAHVTTLLRPVVVQLTCRQLFPAYLSLPPVTRSAGDLKLLAGSRLQLTVKASAPLARAVLRLAGLNREEPLTPDPATPALLHAELEIPARDLTGFSIHLVDTAGIESGETATYRIEVVPDQPPSVKLTWPTRREELATPAATTRLAFEASDDFGIARAVLHYTLAGGLEQTLPFSLTGPAAKTVTRRFEWKLPSLRPRPQLGEVLEYWLTVEDTNTVTGPGTGTTEHYQTRLVTEDEKRLDLANRLSDTMGGLGEVAGSQEQLNKTFGEIIFAAPEPR